MKSLPSCVEYTASIVKGDLIKAAKLRGGTPELHKGKPIRYTGGFCIVYPYIVGSKKYAVRCWHAQINNVKERTKIIAQSLQKLSLPYFVGFEYVDEGIFTQSGVHPIVIMDWVNADSLKSYIGKNLDKPSRLEALSKNFERMVKELHSHNLSHGDLQHGNILVKEDGSIVLVDYDSMFVPELDGWDDEISGLAGYQHPCRWANKKLTPKADYFSELVIYTTIKALAEAPELWYKTNMEGTDTMLFSADDINSGGNSEIFNILSKVDSCKNLVKHLQSALELTSLESLSPLEDLIISPIDTIRNRWNDNGHVPSPIREKNDIEHIRKKW